MQHGPIVTRRRTLLREQNGEVFVEYLVVLAVIFIPLAQTLASTGPGIVKNYQSQRSVLLSINP
jgi:hypothetical protein